MKIRSIANIASFELVRLFLTKRGVLAVIAFSLCWLIILRYPVGQAVNIINSEDFARFAQSVFGMIGLSKLLSWPESEFAMYWLIALYSFPAFCLFLCGDQTVEDRQRGTLRFLSLRATRSEILIGRFIGQLLIVAVLLSLTIFATLAMLVYRDSSLFISGLLLGTQLFGYLLVTVMPFIALMSLLNTFAGSARLALVFAILFFVGGSIILSLISSQIPALGVLNFIFPGYQIGELAGQNASLILGLGLPVLHTVVLMFLAQRLFARSSI